ncbi:MAG: hypothetical protein M2R45_05461 [Verrucomicrobia subdivision 3 bacterium]|nr:hypothetical protein [Limisphaerales bacterium]MCS1417878.1 hypothetical protein [Limisphaerales bacterium]
MPRIAKGKTAEKKSGKAFEEMWAEDITEATAKGGCQVLPEPIVSLMYFENHLSLIYRPDDLAFFHALSDLFSGSSA